MINDTNRGKIYSLSLINMLDHAEKELQEVISTKIGWVRRSGCTGEMHFINKYAITRWETMNWNEIQHQIHGLGTHIACCCN